MAEPVLSIEEYVSQHLEFDRQVRAQALANRATGLVPSHILQMMAMKCVSANYAVNMHSRIIYARAAEQLFSDRIRNQSDARIFAVDLVNSDHICSLEEARKFDVADVRKWVKKQLPDVNFIGGIDAALYYAGELRGVKAPLVSWHAHVMAWGCSAQLLSELQAATNHAYAAGWSGADAFYFRQRNNNKAAGRLMYALKSPLKEYSLTPNTTAKDSGSERLLFLQDKRPLRAHNRVKVLQFMGERKLSDLSCAGGMGRALRNAVYARSWLDGYLLEHSIQKTRLSALGFDLSLHESSLMQCGSANPFFKVNAI